MGRTKLPKDDKKILLGIWVTPNEIKAAGGKEKSKEIALQAIKNHGKQNS